LEVEIDKLKEEKVIYNIYNILILY
jgi:hypothetical protein